MTDFSALRIKMVDGQIRTNSVTDHHVIGAFLSTPREQFVPSSLKGLAYSDQDLTVKGEGRDARALIRVMPLARMIQALDLGADDVVLDLAPATGYSTAILARLAGSVLAVEADGDLAAKAGNVLSALEADNAVTVEGNPVEGLASEAPFDAILISGAVDAVPVALLDQLKDGGRLAAIVGRGGAARATLYVRDGETVSPRTLFNCAGPLVPGFEAKPEFQF